MRRCTMITVRFWIGPGGTYSDSMRILRDKEISRLASCMWKSRNKKLKKIKKIA